MKLGIVYIVGAIVGIGAMVTLLIISESLSISMGGYGRLAVGGVISLWLLFSGIAKIKRGKLSE